MKLSMSMFVRKPKCCVCHKKDLSIIEGDGGTECELSDGQWVCSLECYEIAMERHEPKDD